MEHISDNRFTRSGINNTNEKLFVSFWAELFNSDTIDTYRVRVMNAHNVLQELIDVIAQKTNDAIDSRNIHFVCEEAVRIITQDIICEEVFPAETQYVKVWLLKGRNELKHDSDLQVLVSRIRILKDQLDKNYLECLLKAIEKAIHENETASRLISLTSALATEVVSLGFSLEYLYSRKMVFLDLSRVLTFQQRWDYFKENIKKNVRNFDVFVKFSGPSEWIQINRFIRVEIMASFDIEIDDKAVTSFKGFPGTLVAKIGDVEAADPHSAATKALFEFSTLLDLARFEYRRRENLLISPTALVFDKVETNFFLTKLNPELWGFQSPGGIARLLKTLEMWKAVHDGTQNHLDLSSRERLENSLRYFRMGLDTRVLESRFLHFWISLEFLLKTGSHGSIISPIIEFVPKALALQFFKKLLRDLSANFTRLRVSADSLRNVGISGARVGRYDPDEIFQALRDRDKCKQLVESLSDPMLKYRVSEIQELMCDAKRAKERMVHHLEDLKWHLQRMYRIRNRIAHSAAVGFDLMQVESNLSYYYTMLLNNLLFLASKSGSATSIEELFHKQEALLDFILENLRDGMPGKEILLPQLLTSQGE